MIDLVRAAAKLQSDIDALGIPNCIIGGLAVQAWGEVRMTRDADFTILTDFTDEESKARSILELLTPRRPDALEFGLVNRVLLGYVEATIPVDIGLGGFDFERGMVDRAVSVEFGEDILLRICKAEDLIATKVFAGRGRDWDDVSGIVTRQGRNLDWSLIETELASLLELVEDPERLERLRQMRSRAIPSATLNRTRGR